MRVRILSALFVSALAASGQTPASNDAPKRTIVDSTSQGARTSASTPTNGSTLSGADNGRGASSRALDVLNSSSEDLNVIRDRNVRRLNGDGCAPEVSARINDLRARLQASGVGVGVSTQGNNRASPQTGDLVLASDWFKRTANGSASAAAKAKEREDLLDSVLPGKKSAETPAQDVTSLKAELERLLTTCAAPKR